MATLRNRRRVVPAFGVPMDLYDLTCGPESGYGSVEISDPDEHGRRIYVASAELHKHLGGSLWKARTVVRAKKFSDMRSATRYLKQRVAAVRCGKR